MRVDDESVRGFRTLNQFSEEFGTRFLGSAASLADEMSMGRRSKVIRRRSRSGVIVLDESDPFEFFEDPIDGRGRHFGTLLLDKRGELVGAAMTWV